MSLVYPYSYFDILPIFILEASGVKLKEVTFIDYLASETQTSLNLLKVQKEFKKYGITFKKEDFQTKYIQQDNSFKDKDLILFKGEAGFTPLNVYNASNIIGENYILSVNLGSKTCKYLEDITSSSYVDKIITNEENIKWGLFKLKSNFINETNKRIKTFKKDNLDILQKLIKKLNIKKYIYFMLLFIVTY